jgi:hypothetical protein
MDFDLRGLLRRVAEEAEIRQVEELAAARRRGGRRRGGEEGRGGVDRVL